MNPVTTSPKTYTGREDEGNGTQYYRARYYIPIWKPLFPKTRWVMLSGVGGSPVLYTDPMGLQAYVEGVPQLGPAVGAVLAGAAIWAGNELGKQSKQIGEAVSQCFDKLSCAFLVGMAKEAYELARASSKPWEREKVGNTFKATFFYGGDAMAKKCMNVYLGACYTLCSEA